MKKILLTLITTLTVYACMAAPYITKTANAPDAYIGDYVTYTITIGGITNLNQLTSITDNLGANLNYVGTNFTLSPINAAYSIFCPSNMPVVAISSANVFTVTFPTGCGATLSASDTFNFRIYTKVKEDACLIKGTVLSNTVTLVSSGGVTNSSTSDINILAGVPWELIKNFHSYAGGFLVYDVRLAADHGGYTQQILFNNTGTGGVATQMFEDAFLIEPCVTINAAASQVKWLNNGTEQAIAFTQTITTIGGNNYVILKWSLPATNPPTLNAYLFKVKIKVVSCNCASAGTLFSLTNTATFNAHDLCNAPVNLSSTAKLEPLICGPNLLLPTDSVKVTKELKLDNNNLGYTMSGCTGKYIITIRNTSNFLQLTNIKVTDYAPTGIMFAPNGATYTTTVPLGSPVIFSTTSSMVFNSNASVINANAVIIITVPFTVTTTAPNVFIKNCANVIVDCKNIYSGVASTIYKTACDLGMKTVPNGIAVVKEKKICNASSHTCGPFTSDADQFMPGDEVIYMLHVYNFGTATGFNSSVIDHLPPYFNVNLNDVKVYQQPSGNWIEPCDIPNGVATDITSSVSRQFISGSDIKIQFGGLYPLKPFTCGGITHYFIRIRATIASSAPGGLYNNSFKLNYYTYSPLNYHTEFSNIAPATVSLDQLVMMSKSILPTHVQDCENETDKVDYEMIIANLGQLPIMFNAKDNLALDPGVSTIGGVQNIRSCRFAGISGCTVFTPLTAGVTVSGNNFTLSNILLQPCEVIKVRYTVTYNTGGIPFNQTPARHACNTLIVESGFPGTSLPHLPGSGQFRYITTHNGKLIDEYFNARNEGERMNVIKAIKRDGISSVKAAAIPRKNYDYLNASIPPQLYSFVPITKDTISGICIDISACPLPSTTCINSVASQNISFKITGLSVNGIVNTTLTVNTTNKIKKIEYVLSDIKMANTCPGGILGVFCHACSKNLAGNFDIQPPVVPIGSLNYIPLAGTLTAQFSEKNKVLYESATPCLLSGAVNQNFQLPVSNLNCGGRLEFLITVIVTYADCSICYYSDAYKYSAYYSIPPFPSYPIDPNIHL